MPFKQGNKLSKGRPQGSPNKEDSECRVWLDDFLKKDRELAEKDWQKLSEAQRWNLRGKLLDFKLAKLRSIEVDTNIDISEEAENRILSQLLKIQLENDKQFKYKESDAGNDD